MTKARIILVLAGVACAGTLSANLSGARAQESAPSVRHLAEQIEIIPDDRVSAAEIDGGEHVLPDFVGGPKKLHFNESQPGLAAAGEGGEGSATAPDKAAAAGSTDSDKTAGSREPRKSAALDKSGGAEDAAPAASGGPSKPVEPTNARPVPLMVEPIAAAADPAADGEQKPKVRLVPAKTLFGAAKSPAPLKARAIGSYSRGCLSGAVALPVDGPAWQAMRLSRNRNWGHPKLVGLVERLATEAQKNDGWPGLLVGDLSQPRGGPMLTGHASHQVGLDADVWLTPMPNRKLTKREREDISATSMLDKTDIAVDPKVFTENHVKLIKRAASYPEVERVLVHPAIKKALCHAAGTDRAWLGKVRPIGGHYYHFHIRIGCPAGSEAYCKPQKATTGEDGCTKEVDEWLARLSAPPKPLPPGYKPKPPPPPVTMAELPPECRSVLASGPDGIIAPPSPKPSLATTVAKEHPALQRQLLKLRVENQ